jgi:hypothetical protein
MVIEIGKVKLTDTVELSLDVSIKISVRPNDRYCLGPSSKALRDEVQGTELQDGKCQSQSTGCCISFPPPTSYFLHSFQGFTAVTCTIEAMMVLTMG